VEGQSEEAASLQRTDGNGAPGGQAGDMPEPRSKLKFALRRARVDEAERSEVIAELRGAEIARLEMLKEEVAPLIAELPQGGDFFDLGLTQGNRPRLFIDMIGFVEMGRDRRSYSFVQDTRHGRVILAESERIEPMVEAITNYIARRVIEREKALAGDTTLDQAARSYANLSREVAKSRNKQAPNAEPAPTRAVGKIFALLTELIGSAVLVALVAIGAREVWKYALAWWTGQ
jgi:hypothetical protein